jgi:uncharacterized OB-fold protein
MPVVQYRGMNLVVPENDGEFFGFFEAAKQHKLVVKKCTDCGLLRYPPGAGCPWCQSLDWTWQEVSGKGTIYSYEIIVHSIQPGFRDITPLPVVIVELDEQRGVPTPQEGVRLIANLVDAHSSTARSSRASGIFCTACGCGAYCRSCPAWSCS